MESVNCEESIDKVCAYCKISKTPLWRSGPAGPKSLCNACGIRYRKKSEEKKLKSPPFASPSPTLSCSAMNVGRTMSFKKKKLRINMVALGKEVVLLRRQRSPVRRVKRQTVEKFGEVEKAAFVLMSLSCGLVYG